MTDDYGAVKAMFVINISCDWNINDTRISHTLCPRLENCFGEKMRNIEFVETAPIISEALSFSGVLNTPPASGAAQKTSHGIVVSWAVHQDEVRAAQKLRFDVFAGEMGARLNSPIPGHDIDLFDNYCEHLIVRDQAPVKFAHPWAWHRLIW